MPLGITSKSIATTTHADHASLQTLKHEYGGVRRATLARPVSNVKARTLQSFATEDLADFTRPEECRVGTAGGSGGEIMTALHTWPLI